MLNTEWWVLLGIASFMFIVWCGFVAWALFRRRSPGRETRPINGTAVVAWGGLIVPAIILLGTYGYSISRMIDLANPPQPATLTIDVIGHQWWWEARYPRQGIVTANEIHIPAGQAVEVRLESDDVIHSFWVPEIQKKTDVFPGRVTSTWLQADQPGTYRGQCAEYCGAQHAHMAFFVVADTPAAFAAWVKQESQAAVQPPAGSSAAMGAQTFQRVGCIACHTIRAGNVGAGGQRGPDLTHLASRSTIAAGLLENTRGNLGGWILNSQAIKPGSLMPPQPVNGDDLSHLLDYLESLK